MPTKAAYKLFEKSPETEFEFYLAQKLSMTVERMRDEMSQAEFVAWSIYYARIAQRRELEQAKAGGGTSE